MPLPLVDIGANLSDQSFASDRNRVIERARLAGVKRMIVTGPTAEESELASKLAAIRPGVLYSTAGVHPHHAAKYTDETTVALRTLLEAPHVVAVGECGLDFFRDLSPRDDQDRALRAQIGLAEETGLPLFLHERDAFEAMHTVMKETRSRFSRGVVHCFTGDEEALRAYLDLDLHIGITGWICDERRGTHLRELVRLIPRNRLMIETDAPYLMPRTIRPKPKTRRNEPANLPWVLDAVAECLDAAPEEIAASTSATAEAFFAIPPLAAD